MAFSLDTYTPNNQPSNHRISFSNDFAEAQHQMGRPISQAQSPPPSLDFEFSVSDYGMISADKLFFKGQLVPQKTNTLREELQLGDDHDMFSFGPKKSSNKWKDIFGLKKTMNGPNKVDNDDEVVEKRPSFILEHKTEASNLLHVN